MMIVSSNKISNEKKANKKKANIFVLFTKTFLKWGDEDDRQMANNVNCKEMRFVIGYLIDVDDVSPSTAPEFLPDCLYVRWYFTKEERMLLHNNGKYSPQL